MVLLLTFLIFPKPKDTDKYKYTNTDDTNLYTHIVSSLVAPLFLPESLYQKQEIVTQQMGKWPLCRPPLSMHECVCFCVLVFMWEWRGEISGGSGMITNCYIPPSGPSACLELQN